METQWKFSKKTILINNSKVNVHYVHTHSRGETHSFIHTSQSLPHHCPPFTPINVSIYLEFVLLLVQCLSFQCSGNHSSLSLMGSRRYPGGAGRSWVCGVVNVVLPWSGVWWMGPALPCPNFLQQWYTRQYHDKYWVTTKHQVIYIKLIYNVRFNSPLKTP
jgi:hypothetical protein